MAIVVFFQVGKTFRRRIDSVVHHVSRKAASHDKTAGIGSKFDDAPRPCGKDPLLLESGAQRGRYAMSRNGDVTSWLSYEAAMMAFQPNRGQFFRCLKEARRRQQKYEEAVDAKDRRYLRTWSRNLARTKRL